MEDVVAQGIPKCTAKSNLMKVCNLKSRCGNTEHEQDCGQSESGGSKSFNFEVEPGHLDFLACTSMTYSKPFSSDSGSRRSSDSSTSPKGLSTHSSGIPDNAPKPSLNRVGAPRPQPTRRSQPSNYILPPLLANYTWDQVTEMIARATEENDEDPQGPSSNLLGRGGFGNVYMGVHHKKPVAIKILGDQSQQGDLEFLNEVNLLSSVNHVNLVKLVGYCQEGRHRALVYEYAAQGSIGDHIHGNGDFLDWATRLQICLDSAYGLEYLHTGCNPRIIHRDIKSSNILLTKNLVAKVADFGLSKMGVEDESGNQGYFSTAVKGTLGYLDPSYIKTGKLDDKSDIYSFGVVLLEMITGRKPTDPKADPTFIGDWVKKQRSCLRVIVDSRLGGKYNPKSMKEVVELALRCIEDAPRNRPDIRKVVFQLGGAVEMEAHTLHASRWHLRSLWGQ